MTPADARQALETARTEAAEAHDTVEALAERVRDGDDRVTPEELAGQRSLAELAGLRVEAAERKLATAIEADRHARCTQAAQAARDLLRADDTAPVVEAVTAIRAGLAQLVEAVNARNARIEAVGGNLDALNAELAQAAGTLGMRGSWPLFDQYQVRGDRNHIAARDPKAGGRSATALSAIDLACAAVATVLYSDPNTMRYGDRLRIPSSLVRQLGEDVPGLADAWRATPEEWAALHTTGHTRGSEQGRSPFQTQERAA
ncbi:hypothetical protein ABT264_11255 [Streptomyces virginiae]|uniref:hypothetical protein n=1 Tax=Streptomyces virginiae TaxID=1961 RepID=UPI003332F506